MMRFISLISILTACASAQAPTDELAGTETTEAASVDGKADAAGGTFTYFSITADLRKCMSPVCGGYFLSRVGRDYTWCVDGSARDTCYAPMLDWSEANLSETSQGKLVAAAANATAIVRGRFAHRWWSGFGDLGRFVVTEAWVAENASVPEGVFVKIVPSGIVCITTPCPTITEQRLNSLRSANIAEIDWTPAELTDREIEGFSDDIWAGTGAIIAGDRYYFKGGKGRTATAGYHRLHD